MTMYRLIGMTFLAALAVVLTGLLAGDAFAASKKAKEGDKIYRMRCAACHAMDHETELSGPHLMGLWERPAGSIDPATPALANSQIVWDADTLDAYLADPLGNVPGTVMVTPVLKEKDREALIAYFKSLRKRGLFGLF